AVPGSGGALGGRGAGGLALALAGCVLLVLVEVHQLFELRLVRHLDLDEPPLVQGVLVHQPGVILELAVDRRDRAAEGRDEFRDGADGFDLPEGLALLDVVADVGHLDRDDLPDLVLSELRDPDLRPAPLDTHPEVVLGELESVSHGGLPRRQRHGTSWGRTRVDIARATPVSRPSVSRRRPNHRGAPRRTPRSAPADPTTPKGGRPVPPPDPAASPSFRRVSSCSCVFPGLRTAARGPAVEALVA